MQSELHSTKTARDGDFLAYVWMTASNEFFFRFLVWPLPGTCFFARLLYMYIHVTPPLYGFPAVVVVVVVDVVVVDVVVDVVVVVSLAI